MFLPTSQLILVRLHACMMPSSNLVSYIWCIGVVTFVCITLGIADMQILKCYHDSIYHFK